MSTPEIEPTTNELLAMAFVDGELAPDARREFEARLASDPALRLEVSTLQRLDVMARHMAPAEPMDHEWADLEKELTHAGGGRLGFLLLGVGVISLSAWIILQSVVSDMEWIPKAASLAGIAGILLLLGLALRARLRLKPLDPYTKVKR